MSENEKKEQPAAEEQPASLEDMLNELPIAEKHKAVLTGLATGVLSSLVKINERLTSLESKPAVQDSPDTYEGLTSEQRYNILMARASAPAVAANTQLYQGLLAGMKGNAGSGIDQLLGSVEKLQAFRNLLIPEPSPLQVAMEKAQIQQSIAQTRLMNKIVGKTSMDYLDKLEGSLSE